MSLASDSGRTRTDEQHGQQGLSKWCSSFWAMLSRCADALGGPFKVYILRLTHVVLSLLDTELFREVGDSANLNRIPGNCFVSHFYTSGLKLMD